MITTEIMCCLATKCNTVIKFDAFVPLHLYTLHLNEQTISILATDHLHISFLGCPHGCVEGPHILGVERDHTYWEWRGDHTYWEWRGTTHTGSGEGLCYYHHECVFMHYDKGYQQLSLQKLSLAIVPFFVLRHITTK